jgi:hypothetical protein
MALKLFKARWTATTVQKAGQDFYNAFASRRPLPLGAYQPSFYGILPCCCKDNQRYCKAQLWVCKNAPDLLQIIPETTPLAWVHQYNPVFVSAEDWTGEHPSEVFEQRIRGAKGWEQPCYSCAGEPFIRLVVLGDLVSAFPVNHTYRTGHGSLQAV